VALLFCHFELKALKPTSEAYHKELKTLGDHIRKRRLDLTLLQKDVAKIIGETEATIYNWENNQSEPSLVFVPRIIEFIGYAPTSLAAHGFRERIALY
jgi:DNA-binding XRE family transcriptional regulator